MHCWNSSRLFQLINFVTLIFTYIYIYTTNIPIVLKNLWKIQSKTTTYISNYRITYTINSRSREIQEIFYHVRLHTEIVRTNLRKMMHKGTISPLLSLSSLAPTCIRFVSIVFAILPRVAPVVPVAFGELHPREKRGVGTWPTELRNVLIRRPRQNCTRV